MATRFGATPAQANATKLKWLIGCLVTLVVLLVVAFVFYSQNNSEESDAATNQIEEQPIVQPVTIGAEIIVPIARIEEGAKLDPSMFTTVHLDDDKVPLGAVRKQDLEQIIGKFSNKLLSPNIPLVLEDITESRSVNSLSIPAGYRAVTITVDNRTGVEGFAKPNSRVDVLWTFTQDGKQKVSTIVRFTKVLSVGGVTASDVGKAAVDGGGATTVTLLVSERDAKKIELARTLGALSLSLVGDQEEGTKEAEPDAIDITDLLNDKDKNTQNTQVQVDPADGFMITTDPKTGRQVRYVFNKNNKKWSVDRNTPAEGQQ